MKIWKGVCASGGIVDGYAYLYKDKTFFTVPKKRKIQDVSAEERRFDDACRQAATDLQIIYEQTVKQIGQNEAQIFMAHIAILQDVEFLNEVKSRIYQNINAEYAVYDTMEFFAEAFSKIEDDYLRERIMDVRDVTQRILQKLNSQSSQKADLKENSIVIAQDLLPSQTINLDKEKVNAFLTMAGSPNSHAAILARTREIPAVVALGNSLEDISEGAYLIVDGDSGTIYENPDQFTINWFKQKKLKQIQDKNQKSLYLKSIYLGSENPNFKLQANISTLDDVQDALKYGCDGIGLTRSEFVYMNSSDWPDEDVQFEFYKSVVSAFPDKDVVIRTCDLGMDKMVDYWQGKEENPALGMRGIRLSLAKPEMFFTQLRALLRASVYGNLSIMFPMISAEWEFDQALELAREAKEGLESEGIFVSDNIRYGTMIETPSAAILSDSLAKKADFFSIGTNDLIQYTLCVDRVNSDVSYLYDNCDPAVLKLIEFVINSIHKEGKTCCICGDAATDPKFAEKVIKMGVDGLSLPAKSLEIYFQD